MADNADKSTENKPVKKLSLADSIQQQLADKSTPNTKKKVTVKANDIQRLLNGDLPKPPRKNADDSTEKEFSKKDREEAVDRLKKLFEEKKKEIDAKRQKGAGNKSNNTGSQKKTNTGSKPANKQQNSNNEKSNNPKKGSPPAKTGNKNTPKQDSKKPPAKTSDKKPAADKKEDKKDDKKETPAERLKRVLAERQAERDADDKKKDDKEKKADDDEEAKKKRYEEARRLAEEEIRLKYEKEDNPTPQDGPAKPPLSAKDLPKKPTLKEKVQSLWLFLVSSRFGKTIVSMLKFYQRMAAVLIWTIVCFIAGRFALEALVNIDLFSLSQWYALKELYVKYVVPNNVVIGLLGLSLVWLVGSSIFYRQGWPWVKPIYMFLLQLAALPVGLGLFMIFITLLLTNHVWGKLQSV